MKLLATVLATTIITFFPMEAFAQGFGNNLNINLNDVMVGQRMQDRSQKLNDAQRASIFAPKKEHHKKEKKNKNHKLALLQGEISNSDSAASNLSSAHDAVPDATQMSLTGSIPQ